MNKTKIPAGPCSAKPSRRQEEEVLGDGTSATCVLGERRKVLRKIRIHEDRNPDGDGEEHHRPLTILLPPEHRFKTMGTPECSDGIACEVEVDRRADDGDKGEGVEAGELPLDDGNSTGDQE